MRNKMIKLIAMSSCVALAVVAAEPNMAAPFPEKQVRLVVPFAPGATTDILARLLAQHMSARWKQPVVVENRAGAGSIIGADFVAKSAPDGYTILFGSESLSLLPHLQDMPFDWRTDLKRVSQAGSLPILLLSAGKRADLDTMVQMIAYARTNRSKLNYGSPGTGTVHHLAMELFSGAAGIEMTHVPYKGSGPALQDLIGGNIDVMPGAEPSAKGHVSGGRIRALAVFARERLPGMPSVPTAREAGVPFEESFWWGFMVPGKVPADITQAIAEAAVAAVRDPNVGRRMVESGVVAVGSSPEEFEKFFLAQYEKWGKIASSMKLKVK